MTDAGGTPSRSLRNVDPRERRRAAMSTTAIIAGSWVILILAYYVYPGHAGSNAEIVVRLTCGIALLVVIIAVEFRRIVAARIPQLRAIEAIGVIVPLFLVLFASMYLSLGQGSGSMFNVQLDHTESLYFVITVFSTVGFGDIVPKTDTARLLVAIQMLLDLVIIGSLVRILLLAVNRGLETEN